MRIVGILLVYQILGNSLLYIAIKFFASICVLFLQFIFNLKKCSEEFYFFSSIFLSSFQFCCCFSLKLVDFCRCGHDQTIYRIHHHHHIYWMMMMILSFVWCASTLHWSSINFISKCSWCIAHYIFQALEPRTRKFALCEFSNNCSLMTLAWPLAWYWT